jgi:aspartyl-tRNA(Asn)/glutamyl-tRNA(Gln) amidotransferase subunit A
MFAGKVPDRDAEAVRSARAAGAILLAKTSTDEFAYGITSHNPHLGAVRNPWDPGRISGGSSGGSAASLAAGLAPLALGSDTGGSIRVPASFCGVVGFKPTWDSVSTSGLFPMARTLDHAGPMARQVGDARLLFAVIRRRDAGPAAPGAAAPPRFVVCPDLQIAPPDREIAAAFAAAVERARDAGSRVEERRFADAARLFPTFLPIQQVETSFTHRRRGLYPKRRDGYGDDVQARLAAADAVGLDAYLEANSERDRLRRAYEAMLDGDALLLKAIHSRGAAPIGTAEVEELTRRNAMDQTVPENLLGLPACAIRAGFDREGMPVGIQVIGRRGADDAVLAAAGWLEDLDPDLRDRRPALLEQVSG